MLKLILLRHGKAATAISGQEDYDRPLNRKGVVQINQLGFYLREEVEPPLEILSSSAKRTRETTEIVNHYLQLPDVSYQKELYLASEAEILSAIKNSASKSTMLYVGHNFGISNLAAQLGSSQLSLTTGMMVCFSFNVSSWDDVNIGQGKLEFVMAPNIYLP